MPLSSLSSLANNSISTSPKRYQIALSVAGSTSSSTTILSLNQVSGSPIVRIDRIAVTITHAAAGLGVPLVVLRAASIAGGTLVTAADIPKKDTTYPTATLQVRTSAPTGGIANNNLLIIGGCTVTTVSQGGPLDVWEAMDELDKIVLRDGEGLFFRGVLPADADDRYCITVSWEEE